MHEHMKHEAYLLVLWLMGIYNDKRPNEHATIVDAKGTGEKLEVCVVFFDKLYNCAPIVKLPAKVEPEELWPLPELLFASKFAPTLLQCLGLGFASTRIKGGFGD
ncbi:unnamed protein product [Sphagnum jensenii]|uniref:LAGLIDADG homing endonuclease n=1 Tax=Sphagnum jensenii TaxID=128206 RepID=A0ABP1B569_9BRYO